MENIKSLLKYKSFQLVTLLFVVIAMWRLVLLCFTVPNIDIQIQIWAASYQVVAWVGALIGLFFARSWGGYKSVVGRAALAFSIGLLLQSFGQSVFSYYFYTGAAAPYPSLADLGFFGSIPFYAYGMLMLAKASGAHLSLKSFSKKIQIFLILTIMLLISYIVFLRGYQLDPTQPLKTFLDFGYPLGDAIYVSIALLTFSLSRNFLGGIMKKPVLFLVFALVFQYVTDFTFLYQSSHGTFVGGGINDCMYFTSYFIMALSLVQLRITFDKIKSD